METIPFSVFSLIMAAPSLNICSCVGAGLFQGSPAPLADR
jgi:hypothetical protein